MPAPAKTALNVAVNLLSRSRIRNRFEYQHLSGSGRRTCLRPGLTCCRHWRSSFGANVVIAYIELSVVPEALPRRPGPPRDSRPFEPDTVEIAPVPVSVRSPVPR